MKEHNQRTRIMEVTPEYAARKIAEHEKMIEQGLIRQRPINEGLVKKYAGDMKRGRWALSHQGIAFDEDNRLIDGLKRLWAVRKAKVPVLMSVTTGVPTNTNGGFSVPTMDVIDVGQARTIGHQLHISHGISGANQVASAIRNIVHIHSNDWHLKLAVTTYLEILSIYNKDIDQIFKHTTHMKQRVGAIVAALAIYHSMYPEKARAFAASFFSKENLPKGSPILGLIKWRELHADVSGKAGLMATTFSVCHAIHEYHHDKQVEHVQPHDGAMYWLGNLNKKTADIVRGIVYPLKND